MKTYIALLRGINVSGQKKIKMADLRALLESLGFAEVQTYIQSGNVVFKSSADDPGELIVRIENAIQKKYDFHVPALVLDVEDIREALENNPFKERETDWLHFTFLAEAPSQDRVAQLEALDYPPEEFELGQRVVYLYLPKGYGRAKLNNNFLEQKLKVKATTRNWKTTQKLLDLAGA
jgi:uncharacterized protein (DUF1697 family)